MKCDLSHLQVLIEVSNGEFHAFQCERFKRYSSSHAVLMRAFKELISHKFIVLVGDEYFVSVPGNDVILHSVAAACRVVADEM